MILELDLIISIIEKKFFRKEEYYFYYINLVKKRGLSKNYNFLNEKEIYKIFFSPKEISKEKILELIEEEKKKLILLLNDCKDYNYTHLLLKSIGEVYIMKRVYAIIRGKKFINEKTSAIVYSMS